MARLISSNDVTMLQYVPLSAIYLIKGFSYMPLDKSAFQTSFFLISQPKYVVGAQKNRLIETVLLNTQNISLY